MRTLGTFIVCIFISLNAGAHEPEWPVIGWIEKVSLMPENFQVIAKIDTGADNSSLDAPDYKIYEKNGQDWVRFSITSNDGRTLRLERPVKKITKVKRKGAESVSRPVVVLELCISGHHFTAPVNLADRGNFKYRMLIGRSALKKRFLVDSSQKHLINTDCRKPAS